MNQEVVDRLMTIQDVAALLGCSKSHVYRLIASKTLRSVDISTPQSKQSKTRISSEEIRRYFDSIASS